MPEKPKPVTLDLGRKPKNMTGELAKSPDTAPKTHYPTVTIGGDGEPPDLKDGHYAVKMKRVASHVHDKGAEGKSYSHEMEMHSMTPIDDPDAGGAQATSHGTKGPTQGPASVKDYPGKTASMDNAVKDIIAKKKGVTA